MADIRSSSLTGLIPLRARALGVHVRRPGCTPASLAEEGFANKSGIVPSGQQVMRMASIIEPDRQLVLDWYRNAPIAEFAFVSAEQLVAMGRASAVIEFLQAIRRGDRD